MDLVRVRLSTSFPVFATVVPSTQLPPIKRVRNPLRLPTLPAYLITYDFPRHPCSFPLFLPCVCPSYTDRSSHFSLPSRYTLLGPQSGLAMLHRPVHDEMLVPAFKLVWCRRCCFLVLVHIVHSRPLVTLDCGNCMYIPLLQYIMSQ